MKICILRTKIIRVLQFFENLYYTDFLNNFWWRHRKIPIFCIRQQHDKIHLCAKFEVFSTSNDELFKKSLFYSFLKICILRIFQITFDDDKIHLCAKFQGFWSIQWRVIQRIRVLQFFENLYFTNFSNNFWWRHRKILIACTG